MSEAEAAPPGAVPVPSARTGPALAVQGLRVRYGAVEAVRGIDLELMPGECVAILGANGAGKTSTLRAIAGLVRPSAGQVRIDGRIVTGQPSHRLAQRGLTLVPEGRQIFGPLSVQENLELGGYTRARASVRTGLEEVLEVFPALRPRLATLAGNLSGGEQQMVALGRALMAEPRLLMLDEPSLGLAPQVATQIFQVVAAIAARGLAVLLVEQNVHRALRVASRGYVLELGRVALQGPSADLLASPHVRRAYLGHGMGEAAAPATPPAATPDGLR